MAGSFPFGREMGASLDRVPLELAPYIMWLPAQWPNDCNLLNDV